jgi:hypothetical protein
MEPPDAHAPASSFTVIFFVISFCAAVIFCVYPHMKKYSCSQAVFLGYFAENKKDQWIIQKVFFYYI